LVVEYYPSKACASSFDVGAPIDTPLKVLQISISSPSLPAGGQSLFTANFAGTGIQSQQTSFFKPQQITLQSGDCLLLLNRVGANGVIDIETQATAMLRPLGN
jgi:hypothetical protein